MNNFYNKKKNLPGIVAYAINTFSYRRLIKFPIEKLLPLVLSCCNIFV